MFCKIIQIYHCYGSEYCYDDVRWTSLWFLGGPCLVESGTARGITEASTVGTNGRVWEQVEGLGNVGGLGLVLVWCRLFCLISVGYA